MANYYDIPKHVRDVAIKGADEYLYAKHARGCFDDGDPNNPKYNDGFNYATGEYVSIFGHTQADLLNKQYK